MQLLADWREPVARRGSLTPAQLVQLTPLEAMIHTSIGKTPVLDVDRFPWGDPQTGRIFLLGDACHATAPNIAQGAGLCMEDASQLASLLSQHLAPHQTFNFSSSHQDIFDHKKEEKEKEGKEKEGKEEEEKEKEGKQKEGKQKEEEKERKEKEEEKEEKVEKRLKTVLKKYQDIRQPRALQVQGTADWIALIGQLPFPLSFLRDLVCLIGANIPLFATIQKAIFERVLSRALGGNESQMTWIPPSARFVSRSASPSSSASQSISNWLLHEKEIDDRIGDDGKPVDKEWLENLPMGEGSLLSMKEVSSVYRRYWIEPQQREIMQSSDRWRRGPLRGRGWVRTHFSGPSSSLFSPLLSQLVHFPDTHKQKTEFELLMEEGNQTDEDDGEERK
jgi:hypothetical protein